jgi:hypothetical protein
MKDSWYTESQITIIKTSCFIHTSFLFVKMDTPDTFCENIHVANGLSFVLHDKSTQVEFKKVQIIKLLVCVQSTDNEIINVCPTLWK